MKKEQWLKLLLISPGVITYFCFMVIPIGILVYYSLMDWDGLSKGFSFVGLENYVMALQDDQFIRSTKVTLFMTIVSTVVINILAIFFSILLNRQGKMTNFYRSVFFFPLLLSPVVIGFLWQSILNYNGVFNQLMTMMGFDPIQFLGKPNLAVLTITGIIIWQSLGFSIVLYLAGLQTISKDLYDAVKIDGATKWQTFKFVTYPMLAPAVTINVIFLFTGAMREYDRVAVLTSGGPGGASETMAYTVVREAFTANRLSYAASQSVYLLVLVAAFAVLLTLYFRKREDQIT